MDAALVAACEAGDEDAVAKLLAAGADANADGAKPLLKASSKGHLCVVELLLEAGADVRAQDSLALLYACNGGHLDVVTRLLQAGADVRSRSDSALRHAVRYGHYNVLEHLLTHGAAAANLDNAVVEAIGHNRLDMCDLLLAAGANVHALTPSSYQGDALEAAARAGLVALVERLLERGSDAPAPARQTSLDRALIAASYAGHMAVVRLLLAAGADVHASSDEALVDASVKGHGAVVSLLLAAGADVHSDDDQALRSASAYGQPDAVIALVAAGANVRAKDDEALVAAAAIGHDGVVAQLLAAGADARSGKYRALKRALQNWHFGNAQERQRVLAHLVAAGAATWPEAGSDEEDAASAQTRFLAFINEVVALEQRLVAASERGDVAGVDAVIATPTLALYVDVDMAFSKACREGHAGAVARLIAAGADVHYGSYDEHGGRYIGPLVEACERGHATVVQQLVAAGADINMLEGAPLTLAAGAGHADLIDWLLDHGAAFQDDALRTAAERGQGHAIARLLAAAGAVAAVRASRSAVRAAVITSEEIDKVAIVRQLVDAGAELSTMDDNTLALAAGIGGSLPLVELLLQAGANVHARNDGALVDACSYRRIAVIEHLLDAGANVARVDWTFLPQHERAHMVLRVRTELTGMLPRWMRLVRSLHFVRVRRPLHRALQRARDRLDRPPSSTLGTDTPTREQLIAHLKTAGRRFAREYWAEGLPLFFLQSDLGPVPDEFVFFPSIDLPLAQGGGSVDRRHSART